MSIRWPLLPRADGVDQRPLAEPVTLEPMHRRHLREVVPIEHDAYPKPWSRAVFENEMAQVASGSRYYVVARRRRRVVGYAGLWLVPTPMVTRRT